MQKLGENKSEKLPEVVIMLYLQEQNRVILLLPKDIWIEICKLQSFRYKQDQIEKYRNMVDQMGGTETRDKNKQSLRQTETENRIEVEQKLKTVTLEKNCCQVMEISYSEIETQVWPKSWKP